MLVIGSRAICVHFPSFRAPRDWDLIASESEIRRLKGILPPLTEKQSERKSTFAYDGVMVEVINTAVSDYWARVEAAFREEPTIEDPTLGTMHVAPAAFLLLTKQCGLVYNIVHWHKNLEDLYYLRDRIPRIPDAIADLLPLALDDSRRMFADSHDLLQEPRTCHPGVPNSRDVEMHAELHRRVALSLEPKCRLADAWQAFPDLPRDERHRAMEALLAEEAMVLAAEDQLQRGTRESVEECEYERLVGALRELSTGCLPIGWRYFCVNHFREILALVPKGFLAKLGDLVDGRKAFPHGFEVSEVCEIDRTAPLHPPATGSEHLPRVVGGAPCSRERSVSWGACNPLAE